MAETLFPGVYVEEIGPPRSIEGVPMSVAAFLGQAARGPVAPMLVRSVRDYEDIYGTRPVPGSFLAPAVRAFFANGGKRAWIARVTGAEAADYFGMTEHAGKDEVRPATGLVGLAIIDEIGLVAAPGASAEVQRVLVAHCEMLRDRIAILDGPQAPWTAQGLDPRTDSALASPYAAYYAPWIGMDMAKGFIPPSGAVCGIMARVDAQRGPWKAPANETVMGAHDLDQPIDEEAQSLLNPRGVNCIRALPGRGIMLWGARTLSTNPEWRYVGIRRLGIYIEQSLWRGLQWAVFEPNDEPLWARVRQVSEDFLYRIWLDGGLMGSRPDQAFYVHVGFATMTQNDLDQGRMIVEIGFAPVRPAEFIVLRLMFRTVCALA